MSVSVALAAYNGEKYIAEQINSILVQLSPDDELIVSDDNPAGGIKKIVDGINDERIKYIEGKGEGVVRNFENALNRCTGDYIFLCDQDDVWLSGKIENILAEFENGYDLILHNAFITDEGLNPLGKTCFEIYNTGTGFLKNLVRNSFVGCCMAFKRSILSDSLPFPENTPMHDWWIALIAMESNRKIKLIDKPLIFWRRHKDNVTGASTSFIKKIKFRIKILAVFFHSATRKG